MRVRCFYTLLVLFFVNPAISEAQGSPNEGFHKDIFWDKGYGLETSDVAAFQHLNASVESNDSESETAQRILITGNQYDYNGILLYPDNSPRYKIIYTPGGSSRDHGDFVTEKGRQHIRTFFKNGGSYVGFCGGAAIASLSKNTNEIWEVYYHLWPGYVEQVSEGPIFPNVQIEEESDLLKYLPYTSINLIESVEFMYGSFPVETEQYFPKDTKIQMRFKFENSDLHQKASCWSYKTNDNSGTMIVMACHPEYHDSGEQLELTKSLFLFALDGIGKPDIKGRLEKGIVRYMNKPTPDNNPDFTKIGDRQIHHFVLELDEPVTDFSIEISGENEYDLNIYLKKGEFAFPGKSQYNKVSVGSDKILKLNNLEKGKWYIGIENASSITDPPYSQTFLKKNSQLLNGVEYAVKVEWK